MDQNEIQKRIEGFLKELDVPSFVIFGWKKNASASSGQAEFAVVSSYHEVPPNAAIKGMSWALADFVGKTL